LGHELCLLLPQHLNLRGRGEQLNYNDRADALWFLSCSELKMLAGHWQSLLLLQRYHLCNSSVYHLCNSLGGGRAAIKMAVLSQTQVVVKSQEPSRNSSESQP
jgi:hypothetical protein